MENIKYNIINIFSHIIIKIHPLLGKGKEFAKQIDKIATEDFGQIIEKIKCNKGVEILSVEGERDGITNTTLQNYDCTEKPKYVVSIDPIEGTLTGSLNGSRCLSVIAIAKNNKKINYKKLPDSLSCFSVASQYEKNFLENLSCNNDRKIALDYYKDIFINGNISTLRRKETEELWCNIIGTNQKELFERYKVEFGENTFFMQNVLLNKVFWCGDSSIFLPFESDYFFGRTGVAEARIESQLWKYWRGLLVSSNKMKEYPTGRLNYLIDRLLYVNNRDKYKIQEFFTDSELECMHNNGWKDDEIIDYLEKEDFSPQYDLVMIFSITGTKDKKFINHSTNNMIPLVYDSEKNEYQVELWTIENNKLNKKIIKIKE